MSILHSSQRRRRAGPVALALLAVLVLVSGCRPLRQARVTETPVRTPRPTFTSTPPATPTLPPTPTLAPSPTPLPTLPPTDTPLPTVPPTDTPPPTPIPTAVPLPTDTPPPVAPTAVPTRRPAPTATKKPTPRPTNTPAPAFSGSVVRGAARCDGFQTVTGFVLHANNQPYPGVAVAVWSDAWDGQVAVTEASGKFDLNLSSLPPGSYNVAVVRIETCQAAGGPPVARTCTRVSNIVQATVSANCSGVGANQVTEVKFTGP